MHEHKKICDAHYFLSQLSALGNERSQFTSNLGAFLAAARSALNYARKEAKRKSGSHTWFNHQTADKPVIDFFKEARDTDFHTEPVSPNARLGLDVSDLAPFSDSVRLATIREDGRIEIQETSSPLLTPSTQSEIRLTHEYFFNAWRGNEDVITLCKKYLEQVEAIVADGIARGFLTP